jgi:tetratricopeptide (TPR) repeat protein
MNKNSAIFIILGVIAGFIAGFIVANKLNASEINTLRGQSAPQTQPANSASSNSNDDSLAPAEIEAKIAEADKNPTNFSYQKNLGISLYRYGAMKQNEDLIERSMTILERANSLDGKDFEVLVALGNAQFDIGFFKKDRAMFDKARVSYNGALAIKPADADVRTDLGISYFVQEPPDYDRAVTELQKVLAADPKHDRAMQFLVQVYAKQGKIPEAEKMLGNIIALNPSNPAIADLRLAISNAKAGK